MEYAKDFQVDIINTVCREDLYPSGCILLMDMGTGKTFTSLQIIWKKKKAEERVLIIVPATKVRDWKEEMIKWLAIDEESIGMFSNKSDFGELDIWISSFEMVQKSNVSKYLWDYIILDESQAIKNPSSKRSQVIRPLMHKSKFCLLCTGTIAPNAPWEMYTQIDAVSKGLLGSWIDYITRYCDAQWNPFTREWYYKGSTRGTRGELHDIVKSVSIRAKKSICLKLDPKLRYWVDVEIDLSDSKVLETKLKIDHKMGALEKYIRKGNLNKVESSKRDRLVIELGDLSTEAKIHYCKEWVKVNLLEGNDEQLIIFAAHIKVVDEIEEWLNGLGYTTMAIHAEKNKSAKARFELIKKFQAQEIRVAVLGLKACNAGINLTPCHRTCYLEFDFTPGNLLQAECRTDRIGAVRQTHHYYLVGRDTYDPHRLRSIMKKDTIMNEIIDQEESELVFHRQVKANLPITEEWDSGLNDKRIKIHYYTTDGKLVTN